MYRPVGWKKLREHPCADAGCIECRDAINYERGADAMLAALRAMAKNLTDGCGNVNSIYKYVRIPDDIVVRRVTPSPSPDKGKNS